uniref:C2H2-type domain-containing protein n=1 Tax=Musa acuminata subsp. malaccensis TaxID=214687 RepID=A0A804K1P9_MUSAM|nr:PREDICTED: histone deacetylase HDT1-like isoform X1 [Musa acuminata subsp. malaccensis]
MEFWGVEIKPEETVKVDPGEDKYLHLSQASLGETKKDKGNENILIYVKFNNQKLVLGTLSADKCAQIQYDLVFEKEFEISHNSKNASVYLCGYRTVALGGDEFPDFDESDSDADEDIQLEHIVNGKTNVKDEQPKSTAGKPNVASAKVKPKVAELKKADKQKANKEDDEDDEESEEDESDDDEDTAKADAEDDSEDEDESSDEDEATVKKAEPSNKRPAGSALKTPVSEKKAKLRVSQGSGGSQKKGGAGKNDGQPATPNPAKRSGKTPATNDKSKQQTPKSAGSINCKSCGKKFNSDNGLQAHTKAKHGGAK